MTEALATVLRRRRSNGSGADSRTDEHRVALVIEGGGTRSAYSAGMALALAQCDLVRCFDAIYATSGGALNGSWLLTGDGERWLPSWAFPEVLAAGVVNPWAPLRRRPIVDLQLLVDQVYRLITPMDFEAIVAHPTSLHPIATDARTGLEADLHHTLTDPDSVRRALRATGCLPLLAGQPVRIGDRAYFDGGLSQGVPIRAALDGGATHVLVLRTRRADQQAAAQRRLERWLLAGYFRRHGPAAGRALADRHLNYRRDDAWLRRHAGPASTAVVAEVRPPDHAPDLGRLSREPAAIRAAVDAGASAARGVLDEGNLTHQDKK